MGELCEGNTPRLDDQLAMERMIRAGVLSAFYRVKTRQLRFPVSVAI